MAIRDIPLDVQKQICGTEEIFFGKMSFSVGAGTPRESQCVFLRTEICPGLEKISYMQEPDITNIMLGYYDRERNLLDYYFPELIYLENISEFALGEIGPNTDPDANRYAIQLLAPFLFIENGDLNLDELEMLGNSYDEELQRNTVLLFATALYADDKRSFKDIVLMNPQYTLINNKNFPNREKLIHFDTIAEVHFLRGKPNETEQALRAVREIVCTENNAVARVLYTAWHAFQEAKLELSKCKADHLEKVDKLYDDLRTIYDGGAKTSVVVRVGARKTAFGVFQLLRELSPLGIQVGYTTPPIPWNTVSDIKYGNRILWRK